LVWAPAQESLGSKLGPGGFRRCLQQLPLI
jgi:hypothetical protein